MTDHTRPVPAIDHDWFAWLIDPLPTDEFERDYYEQRLVHIRREASPYYAELLSVARPRQRARYSLGQLSRHQAGPGRWRSSTPAGTRTTPAGSSRWKSRGSSTTARPSSSTSSTGACPRWRACALRSGGASRRGSRPTCISRRPTRRDSPRTGTRTDVFVVQVSGTKLWSIYDTKVRLPLRGQRFERGTPPGDVTDEFELGPGSAVYLPRGLMHSARSTDEPSLHVTLGLTAFTWAEFLVESVTAAALEEESLRPESPPRVRSRGISRRRARASVRREDGVRAVEVRPGGRVAPFHGRGAGQRCAAVYRPVERSAPRRPADATVAGNGAAPGLLTEAAKEGDDVPAAVQRPGAQAAGGRVAGAAVRHDGRGVCGRGSARLPG